MVLMAALWLAPALCTKIGCTYSSESLTGTISRFPRITLDPCWFSSESWDATVGLARILEFTCVGPAALELDRGCAAAYAVRATVAEQRGDLETALADAQQAASLMPDKRDYQAYALQLQRRLEQ